MKITLLTYGSRGDVQPFVALARRLLERGHTVKLAGPHRFAGFVAEQGVPFVPLAGDPEEISRRINESGASVPRMMRGMQEYIFSIAGDVARSAFAACELADLIIHSFLFTTGAHSLARQMGVPDISAQLFPMFAPTKEFPNVALAEVPPGLLSYFTHWMADQIFWYGGNSGYRRLRRQAPEVLPEKLYWPFRSSDARARTPILGAWSSSVLAPPHDWPEDAVQVTGYWFLDEEEYQPPAELVDFLSAGERPVCITFGSMIHRQAGRIARDVIEALSSAGERAVILAGWQPWEVEPREDVLFLPEAPHAWLFPRCKTLIHHGGAGSTAAGLRSGVPNIAIPFAVDQLFWAKRLHALGLMREPVRVEKLTASWLTGALRESQERDVLRRAKLLGRQIEGEDGLGRAVGFIEQRARRIF